MHMLIKFALAGAVTLVAFVAPVQATPPLGEISPPAIRAEPVRGVVSEPWDNYVADFNGAEKELTTTLIARRTKRTAPDADEDYLTQMRRYGNQATPVTVTVAVAVTVTVTVLASRNAPDVIWDYIQ